MATTFVEDVTVDKETEAIGNEGSKKRFKQKGASHALQWEILDNENVKAEDAWEAETEEFWTSKTCKKYVKMYHIDKLWPRECHESHTKNFACRPWMCKNDHFNHRAEEVWRALFGDRPRNKGFFNYSLVSMVYAELILKRKVDWSTFPTTAQFPLRIARRQKYIPDLYDPDSDMTKNILEELKKRPQRAVAVDTKPTMHEVPSTTGLQVTAVPPERKDKLDSMVENILSTMFPMRSSNDKTVKDLQQSGIQNTTSGGGEDNVTPHQESKSVGIVETIIPTVPTVVGIEEKATDAGPSSPSLPTQVGLAEESKGRIGMEDLLPRIEEILRTLPNRDDLQELVKFGTEWAKYCGAKEWSKDGEGNEEATESNLDPRVIEFRRIMDMVYAMKRGSTILTDLVPDLVLMTQAIASLAPPMAKAALGIDKMSSFIMPILTAACDSEDRAKKLEIDRKKMTVCIQELAKELEEYKMGERGRSSAPLEEFQGT